MSDLLLRLATEEDSREISAVLAAAFREFEALYSAAAFAATVISPDEVCRRIREAPLWLAEYDGKIVGAVSILPQNNELYIRGMAVLPAVRGLKIGLALLQQVENFALQNACKRLFLRTTPYLDKAIRLYENFGFVRVGTAQEDFFGTPSFLMEKMLDYR